MVKDWRINADSNWWISWGSTESNTKLGHDFQIGLLMGHDGSLSTVQSVHQNCGITFDVFPMEDGTFLTSDIGLFCQPQR